MTTKARTRIDFAAVADGADLRRLIVAELGEPDRSRKWRCPFHDDEHPSFGLTNGGKTFRCWACGAKGDALKWMTLRGHAGNVVEAAKLLDPSLGPYRPPRGPSGEPNASRTSNHTSDRQERTTAPVDAPATWADIEWQAALDGAIVQAEANLWSGIGTPALAWLKSRGLMEHTIRTFRLGFLPADWRSGPLAAIRGKDGGPGSIWLPRGVVIPWLAPGAWYGDLHDDVQPMTRWCGANCRRLMPDASEPWPKGKPKCVAASGSVRGHGYPFPDEMSVASRCDQPPILIVEGEIDALLAHQHLGHLVTVTTAGSANQDPMPGTLEFIKGGPMWLLAHDADKSGEAGSRRWRTMDPARARRMLYPPEGSDIGELVQAGVDLIQWLRSECRRVGVKL